MIANVLSEALREIERHENDPTFARQYERPETRILLAACKGAMRELLRHLETAPPQDGGGHGYGLPSPPSPG